MDTNISLSERPEEQVAQLLALIGQPARIQILLALRAQEACVCHLEAVLGARQASISQHLMILRKAGLVSTRRDGRNIFYRLTQPGILEMIDQAARMAGVEMPEATQLPVANCSCPHCNPGLDPRLTCRPKR